MRQPGTTVLAGVVLLGAGAACDAPRGSDDLFVTMQETTGDETVFRLGTNVAAGCGSHWQRCWWRRWPPGFTWCGPRGPVTR